MNDADHFYARNRQEWRDWLTAHDANESSVWLVFDKGKDRQLSYDEIVEEALCFGWVDSRPGKVSDTQSKLYISKRKPRSAWSKSNKVRVEALTKAGLMADAGLAAVAVAKQNGAWVALNKSDALELPQELRALLAVSPKAKSFYDSMSPSSHRIILEWIYSAKTETTRLSRINETVQLAEQGIKAHHYRQ